MMTMPVILKPYKLKDAHQQQIKSLTNDSVIDNSYNARI